MSEDTSEPKLVGQLFSIGTGIALAVALFFLSIAGARWHERQLDASFAPENQNLLAEAHATTALDPVAAQVTEMCREEANRSTGNNTSVSELALEAEQVRRFAEFLSCTMTTHRERFCEAAPRERLTKNLKTYLKIRKELRAGLRFMQRAGIPSIMLGEEEDTISAIETAAAEDIDGNVVAGLRDLLAEGYISRSDIGGFLGWSMPREISPLIADVEVTGEACG